MLIALLFALMSKPADSRAALEAQFRAIAQTAGGTVGVSVLHLESGKGASFHGSERFPMASVFKLALAVELSRRVDRGTLRLDQRIALAPADMRDGGPLSEKAPHGDITPSLGELLEAMLVDGDNTAADALMPLVGGPEVVTAQLDGAGLGDIRIDRSELELAFDATGATPPSREARSLSSIGKAFDAVPAATRREALARFLADPRDTATPDALVQLLRQVQEGRNLSPESRDRILALLVRTRPGAQRLKGALPAGTVVAHRTGTGASYGRLNVCTNDVGLVTLPDGRGHLAIAVLVKGSDRDPAAREKAIAEIARAAYDYWMR